MIITFPSGGSIDAKDGATLILRDAEGKQLGYHDRPQAAFDDAIGRGLIEPGELPAMGVLSDRINHAVAALQAGRKNAIELGHFYKIKRAGAFWTLTWQRPGKPALTIEQFTGAAGALSAAVYHRLCRGPGMPLSELLDSSLAALAEIVPPGLFATPPATPPHSTSAGRSAARPTRKTGIAARRSKGLGLGLGGGIGKGDLRL